MNVRPIKFACFMPGLSLVLLILAGCQSDTAPPEIAAEAASSAVSQGLVGALFGQVSAEQREFSVAGLRQLGSPDVLNGQELFLFNSNGKAMTALVAARLIERGVLRWDSKISEAIPALQANMHADYRNVTLEQLLAHRGGVLGMTGDVDIQRFKTFLDNYTGDLPQTLVDRRRFFADWMLMEPPPTGVIPGQDFLYSNAGYALVGAMMEAVTGKSYETLFDEELTQPLGVPGSWILPRLTAADQPAGHSGARDQLVVVAPSPADYQQWVDVTAPSGLFSTTAEGYLTWLNWHLLALQGQTTPLPAGYVQRLQQMADGDYAVGWFGGVDPTGQPVLVHGGSGEGFMSLAVIDLAGQRARFGVTNTEHTAADESSWVDDVLSTQLLEMDRRSQAR